MKEVFDGKQGKSGEKAAAIQSGIQKIDGVRSCINAFLHATFPTWRDL